MKPILFAPLLLVCALALPAATAKISKAPDPIKAVPLTANLYLVQGLGEAGNVAFLVTEKGVVVVDSGTQPGDGSRLVGLVKTVTPLPIRYLILTHYHDDHTLGLQSLPDSVQVIGQDAVARNMKEWFYGLAQKRAETELPQKIAGLQEKAAKLKEAKSPELEAAQRKLQEAHRDLARLKQLKPRYPDLTFSRSLVLHLGADTVHIIHPDPAHTSDNVLVLFPRQKAVHMGDMLFHRHLPYIDWNAGAHIANWQAQLTRVLDWDVEIVIPGHGPVAGKEALKGQARYFDFLRGAVAAEMVKGGGLEAVRAAVKLPAEYKEWGFLELFLQNIGAAYRELIAPAKEIATPKKPSEMGQR